MYAWLPGCHVLLVGGEVELEDVTACGGGVHLACRGSVATARRAGLGLVRLIEHSRRNG